MKSCVSAIAGVVLLTVSLASAANVVVPNASFEGPVTTFADPRIDAWQDYPKPASHDELTMGPWDFKTGVFKNTDPGSPDHIHNIDGAQAMFLFADPGVGIFQDYNSTDWAHPLPTHEFNSTYQTGKAYHLTVGVIGGGGGMREGATLGVALYYRDASSNMVFVAMTNVAHSTAVFPTRTNFVDIPVISPVVKASDGWASQNIGIALFSGIVDTNLAGGYWDLDNVRLQEIERPRLLTRRIGEITVESEPGLRFEILAASSLNTPMANWAVLGTVAGGGTFVDQSTTKSRRFYIARYAP